MKFTVCWSLGRYFFVILKGSSISFRSIFPSLPSGSCYLSLCISSVLEFHRNINGVMCTVLYLASFDENNVFEIHPCCHVNQCCIHFCCWILLHYMDIPKYFYSFSNWKKNWDHFQFCTVEGSCQGCKCINTVLNMHFHYSWANAQEQDCWALWWQVCV